MDKETITTAVRFRAIEHKYENGGYYSDAVNQQMEKFRTLGEEDQQEFFKAAFNATYVAAKKVREHPRFSGEVIDLTNEGLGIIKVNVVEFTDEDVKLLGDGDSSKPFIGLEAFVTSIDPDLRYDFTVYAHPDGGFDDDNGHYDIDTQTKDLLDAKETLDLVCQALGIE